MPSGELPHIEAFASVSARGGQKKQPFCFQKLGAQRTKTQHESHCSVVAELPVTEAHRRAHRTPKHTPHATHTAC